MKKFKSYIQSAWYNLRHNKMYALFCVLGTTLTFIFITLLLELTYSVSSNIVPFVNGDRTIHLSNSFTNVSGQFIGGIETSEIPSFIKDIKDLEGCALADDEYSNVFTGSSLKAGIVTFVNADYWKVNQFKFIQGRAFTEEECTTRKPVAVIKKNIADSYFKDKDIVGKKIEIQKNNYTIIGVVDDFSSFATNNRESIWVPNEFNKFIPSGNGLYNLFLLFPDHTPVDAMKQQVARVIKFHFEKKNQNVDISPEKIFTVQEEKINKFGNRLLSYGVPVILFLLLIVPAINILTLSIANTKNRAQEIAIRRAMGANKMNSFIQIILENLLLVLMGTCLGLLLTYPVANLIEKQFLHGGMTGNMSLISHLDYGIIFGIIIPLSIVFSLLSGGIPAYLIAKKNIAETLKGGSK